MCGLLAVGIAATVIVCDAITIVTINIAVSVAFASITLLSIIPADWLSTIGR